MLTYLINVTDDMLFVSLVLGVILAVMDTGSGKAGKIIVRSGLAAGFIIAAVRSYITNTRRLVGGWKVGTYGYGAALVLFLLLVIAFIIFGKKFLTKKGKPKWVKTAEVVISTVTALLIAACLYCGMPNVYVYPFKFDTGGNGVLSTDYLFRLDGYLAGIIVCLVSAVAAYKLISVAVRKGSIKLSVISFFLLNTMLAVYHFAKLMLVLTPRKIVDSIELFNFASVSNNLAHWYTFAAFIILAVIGIVIWVRSYTSKEPYSTNAQHRKQRSVWRTGKRYFVTLFCCFVVAVLCATWFVELNKDEALIDLGWDKTPRQRPKRDPELFKTFCNDMGVLTEEQVKAEAGRCLSCGATEVDENRCIGCGLCTTRCKFDAIHLLRTHPAASKMVSCDKKVLPLAGYAAKRAGKIIINKVSRKG